MALSISSAVSPTERIARLEAAQAELQQQMEALRAQFEAFRSQFQ